MSVVKYHQCDRCGVQDPTCDGIGWTRLGVETKKPPNPNFVMADWSYGTVDHRDCEPHYSEHPHLCPACTTWLREGLLHKAAKP